MQAENREVFHCINVILFAVCAMEHLEEKFIDFQ